MTSASSVVRTLLVVVLALAATFAFAGCRRGMADSEESSSDPIAHNALEAANMWPGARAEFVAADGSLVVKLRQRKAGFKVFDAMRRPVGLVLAKGDQIDMVPLGQGRALVLLKDDAAKEKLDAVAADPGPSEVYTLFEAATPTVIPADGDDDKVTPAKLEADRGKPVLRVVAFDLDDGRHSWRVLDIAGKRLADLVPFGDAVVADRWLFGASGEGDLGTELIPTTAGLSRGLEARKKGSTDAASRSVWIAKTKMPASVLGALLLESDGLAAKAVIMQLFRCDGLEPCREKTAAAPVEAVGDSG
jgi:hypothetical protein